MMAAVSLSWWGKIHPHKKRVKGCELYEREDVSLQG